jgi:hypothetical protein
VPEHRKYTRHDLSAPAAFQLAGGPRVAARYQNLSLGGAYIETTEPVAYGTQVSVFLHLPGLAGEARFEATVRWTKRDGMGVQFGLVGARETHALTLLLGARG